MAAVEKAGEGGAEGWIKGPTSAKSAEDVQGQEKLGDRARGLGAIINRLINELFDYSL